LLGKRSYQSPHPGTWSNFGGKAESTDSGPKSCALREFQEESQISDKFEISKNPFYVQDDPDKIFYNYIGVSDGKPSVTIDKEHSTYGWFPLSDLPSNLHPGFQELISKKGKELKELKEKIKENEN
ncbi:MAG TPA: NUDIX hydrolase, partial [Nitrosopumilaceae archaeon]|nr:NUDIX hydrolase [Nitrosopumilaceae archaeon]